MASQDSARLSLGSSGHAALLAGSTIASLAYAVGVEHGLPDLRLRTFTQYDDAIRWLEEGDCAPAMGGSDR